MNLADQRQAIRLLLDERNPGDAMAAYYAFHHAADRTRILLTPENAEPGKGKGYIAISQTGLDLFRPLLTMRLPQGDLETSGGLLSQALPTGAEAFLVCPQVLEPLVRAFFEVQREELLTVLVLERRIYEPIINVLVTYEEINGMPRYVIKQPVNGRREAVAAAGLNWQSPYFAEIAVRTWSDYRRRGFGKSVVAALAQHILDNGRRPLYAVAAHNTGSIELARSIGFVDSGYRQYMMEVRAR